MESEEQSVLTLVSKVVPPAYPATSEMKREANLLIYLSAVEAFAIFKIINKHVTQNINLTRAFKKLISLTFCIWIW